MRGMLQLLFHESSHISGCTVMFYAVFLPAKKMLVRVASQSLCNRM